jgi:O-antigen/teichoic acid export membrane protein
LRADAAIRHRANHQSMRRFEFIQIIRNVSSNWIALATNVLVGFFLWPFILHRLGDYASGVWVLIFSITGYYGLFDLGIRSSVVRYVSKARATNDLEYASRLINTSLFSYVCIGAFTFLITVFVTAYVDTFFRIPVEFHSTARWLLFMVGSAVSLGFPLGISGGVLEALQRFDLQSLTSVASTLLRALLIVIALRHGRGLLMVAFITVALPVIASGIRSVIAWQLLPVRLSLSYVDGKTFREMANYGGITFITIVSARLRFRSDEIIIGTFLAPVAITYFNIGGRIVDYAEEVVTSFAQILVPMSSHSDAIGEINRLRKLLVAGNRFSAFITFPICTVLVILGRSVIEAWVGKRYVAQSYPVLLLMVLPSTLMMAQSASGRVLFGMAKHKTLAIVTLIEGVANIILSIILVRPYGIVGDAVGTAIPLTATMIFFLPGHVCRKLQIPLRTFLREAYALPLIVCAPTAVALLLLKRWFVPHTYAQLGVHLGVAGVVYGGALLWAFASKRALKVGTLHTPEDLAPPIASGVAAESLPRDI